MPTSNATRRVRQGPARRPPCTSAPSCSRTRERPGTPGTALALPARRGVPSASPSRTRASGLRRPADRGSLGCRRSARHIGVSTTPGAKALTVIPCSIRPRAVAWVTASVPNFATQYGTKSQNPCRPAIDPVLMIFPPEPWAIICRAASWVQTMTLQVLTWTISSKFASSTSMKSRGRFIPALLKITLSGPNVSTAVRIMACTWARSVTSTPTDAALPPLSTMASATDCAATASRSATTIFPPSAAIAWQAAAPIPPAPPVTITTRSWTRPISILAISQTGDISRSSRSAPRTYVLPQTRSSSAGNLVITRYPVAVTTTSSSMRAADSPSLAAQ